MVDAVATLEDVVKAAKLLSKEWINGSLRDMPILYIGHRMLPYDNLPPLGPTVVVFFKEGELRYEYCLKIIELVREKVGTVPILFEQGKLVLLGKQDYNRPLVGGIRVESGYIDE
ncbi:MAG: hypothetical protein DRJ40_00795 [Thermoprotei archaeon]|nr:MAG: hypothetical protein DRJ40_00795 [Thermoprotei archaeon]